MNVTAQMVVLFLSTPSARRATRARCKQRASNRFLSTPSARRATTSALPSPQKAGISIHALREEGDTVCLPLSL